MILKIIAGAVMALGGLVLIFLGVVFVIASGDGKNRLISGFLLTAAGAVITISGIRIFRTGISISPSVVREKILKLAGRNHGELPEEVITGEIGSSDTADFQLQSLIKSGIAKKSIKDGRTFYLFSQFNVKLVVKKCPYCGNDYPVRTDIEKCSSCGGDLKLVSERIKGAEDSYSMD